MKRILSSLLLSALLASATTKADPADPQISDFSVSQDTRRVVSVAYTLDEAAYVTMDVLTNGVSIGGQNIQNVVGDCFKLVPAGAHTIRWFARVSWPDQRFDGNVVTVRLTASAADVPPDVMDINLETKDVAYYPSMDYLPDGGLANDKYRTTHLVMKKVHAAGQTFTMGSPPSESPYRSNDGEDPHLVSLTHDFYLAIYETTRKQFSLMGCAEPTFGTAGTPYGTDDPDQCPADRITYNNLRGAYSSIDWPNTGTSVGGYLATIRTTTGISTFDLPTEAQWEFACRAGTTTAMYNGKGNASENSNSDVAEIAWYYYNSDSGSKVHAVGGKPANPWGFYDMYGNVREWCLDWWGYYDTSVSPAIDPVGPTVSGDANGGWRMTRGGDYTSGAKMNRSAYRGGKRPQNADATFGFRLCLPLQ